ncbi:hypothetical protein ACP4OV_024149 [Aristida adscensionis]
MSSLEAERAHVDRVLGTTTTILFSASLSYIVLSTLYAASALALPVSKTDDDGDGEGDAAEESKCVLEEIPVVVVQVLPDDHGGAGDEEVATSALELAGEGTVCLAEYVGKEEVHELPACRHAFHRNCVDRWLLMRTPTCFGANLDTWGWCSCLRRVHVACYVTLIVWACVSRMGRAKRRPSLKELVLAWRSGRESRPAFVHCACSHASELCVGV